MKSLINTQRRIGGWTSPVAGVGGISAEALRDSVGGLFQGIDKNIFDSDVSGARALEERLGLMGQRAYVVESAGGGHALKTMHVPKNARQHFAAQCSMSFGAAHLLPLRTPPYSPHLHTDQQPPLIRHVP